MAGRKRHEEHENHERWLVSYADFITLLFAFFVVMYAVSSVNEGKYRVLSDSLVAAFRNPNRSLEPIQVGELARSPALQIRMPVEAPRPMPIPSPVRMAGRGEVGSCAEAQSEEGDAPQAVGGRDGVGDRQDPGARPADPATVVHQIESALADLIARELIEVRRDSDRVEVEIKTSILFPSGSARLVNDAIPILRSLSEILKGFPNPVRVEGFTDDVPISTEVYPSNWELSAARAASVVHVYSENGVRPERMAAIGYAEYRPVADNTTAEGRSRNRRVVIVIPAVPGRRAGEEPPPALDPSPNGGPADGQVTMADPAN
jgi:chemotaxis protein MotB